MKKYFKIILILLFFSCNKESYENEINTPKKINTPIESLNLNTEREQYNTIIKRLTDKDIEIITKEKIYFEENRAPFNPDYRKSDPNKYQYYPYYRYKISDNVYHVAFSCIAPDRKKSYFVVLKEEGKEYLLTFIHEYNNKEFFITLYTEQNKQYIQLQFQNDTDYADFYLWDGKTYVLQKMFE